MSWFMVASAAFSAFGSIQAGKAEKQRQARKAAQYKENAKFEALKAMQDHNKRIAEFSAYASTANTVRAINSRGSNDRSYKAIMKASGDNRDTNLGRENLQSLFTQSRMRFAASDARFAGQQAQQTAMYKALGSTAMAGHYYQEID